MMMSGGLETDPFELKRMMRQEAHEKAFEIQVMSQRLYEKAKDQKVQEGLLQMNDNYNKKLQKLTQDLNISRSKSVNEVRLQKMNERNNCMESIRKETRQRLLKEFVNPENQTYRQAVKNLLIQVIISL